MSSVCCKGGSEGGSKGGDKGGGEGGVPSLPGSGAVASLCGRLLLSELCTLCCRHSRLLACSGLHWRARLRARWVRLQQRRGCAAAPGAAAPLRAHHAARPPMPPACLRQQD